MRFTELLSSGGVGGVGGESLDRGDPEIAGVAVDSRRCERGSCFVAVCGPNADGHEFIQAAVKAGAAAVVCEDSAAVPTQIARATVPDSRVAAGGLAQAAAGWPARKLTKVGVTGTNGKTTVTHLIREILCHAGLPAGLVGTISYQTGTRAVPAGNTTPGPVQIAEITAEMVEAGLSHLVMEVSSHALDQRRAAGLEFEVGVFTNLSRDHLDYHGTMERYLASKLRLFEQLDRSATAVINRDEQTGQAFAAATDGTVLWYGLSPAADMYGRIDTIDAGGTRFELIFGGQTATVRSALIGRHNVYNCLAAGAAGAAMGIDLATVAEALSRVPSVPGRLERVPADKPFQVFVDYAHTDDALANVLGSLRPLTRGRLIVAFGCGGDRDRGKRPRMGGVAEDLADLLVITSDNPRSERPGDIIAQIVAGLSCAGRTGAIIEPDRRKAIGLALAEASAGDVVLIAGKGHEKYQDIAGRRVPFDDVAVAAAIVGSAEAVP